MKLMRVVNDTVVDIVDVPDIVRVLIQPRGDDGSEPIYEDRPSTADDFFHPDLGFIAYDGKSQIGWVWKGKVFVAPSPPPPPPLADIKARARVQVVAFADQITSRITGQYPAAEVASWPTQEAEARNIIDGADASAAPLISALAAGAKMAVADYANSVLAKATAYRQVVAAVKAIRDATDAAIDAATTPEAVGAALEQARQTALAKAAQLGLV
ncbi:MAG: hypothetical protein LCH61_16940 [Proteobacteria bacterium]|nr:hypothetical protein [Pseudomonadota bacterium]